MSASVTRFAASVTVSRWPPDEHTVMDTADAAELAAVLARGAGHGEPRRVGVIMDPRSGLTPAVGEG